MVILRYLCHLIVVQQYRRPMLTGELNETELHGLSLIRWAPRLSIVQIGRRLKQESKPEISLLHLASIPKVYW